MEDEIIMDKRTVIGMERTIANMGAIVIDGPLNEKRGYHKLFIFCNGYGISVRRSYSSYATPGKMDFEVAGIKHYYSGILGHFYYHLEYSGSFKDDVIGYAVPERVAELAREVGSRAADKNADEEVD